MTALRSDSAAQALISSIRIEPDPATWGGLMERRGATKHPKQDEFRRELGLPVDRPVVMSGHQAGFWHSGIAAKYFALDAARRAFGAAGAWIVVDQDTNSADEVRYPSNAVAVVGEKGETGRLSASVWRIRGGDAGRAKGESPTGLLAAGAPSPIDAARPPASESIRTGLERLRAALSASAGEASFARQITVATLELLADIAERPVCLYASDLAKTSLFGWLIDRMIEDPRRCVETYNRAVQAHPDAGVAMLRLPPPPAGSSRTEVELPLWRLSPTSSGTGTRERVMAEQLRSDRSMPLAPRALLMTAVLRLAACDLFIHGTGGAAYDRVTDQWMRDWLSLELAPTAMTTASMYLPLGAEPERAAQMLDAQSIAHRAKHDPALLGDAASAKAKRALLEEIRAERQLGRHPYSQYRKMHELLEQVRGKHAVKLAELQEAAKQARAALASAQLAADRTWAFPLFDHADLRSLKRQIDERFGLPRG